MRSTELNAVIGRSQLKRLDANNKLRTRNLELFLDNLDPSKYQTDFATEGQLQLRVHAGAQGAESRLVPERDARAATSTASNSAAALPAAAISSASRTSASYVGAEAWKEFPQVDHVHFYGFYLGNYPGLETAKIRRTVRAAQFVSRANASAEWDIGQR